MKLIQLLIFILTTLAVLGCRSSENGSDAYGNFESTATTISAETGGKILFLNEPTVIHHLDHDFSIDKSDAAILGRPKAYRRILTLDLPDDVKQVYKVRLAYANHDVSRLFLKNRKYARASLYHAKVIKSLSLKESLGIYYRGAKRLLRSNSQ